MPDSGEAPSPIEPEPDEAFARATRRVTESILNDERTRWSSAAEPPDTGRIAGILEQITWLLFPGFFRPCKVSPANMGEHVGAVIRDVRPKLAEQVSRGLRHAGSIRRDRPNAPFPPGEADRRADRIVVSFLDTLPEVRRLLSLDVQAAMDGDPSAIHTDEIILCYPGFRALVVHRIAHELYRLNVPLIPRIMAEHAHAATGIDIHPGARIGGSFFIDHGTGVVIGETTVIGNHCKVYQGVTLGAASLPRDDRGRVLREAKRHPTVEDHVTIYAEATILGGETVIGAGSVVNGGVFLTRSVPPGHVVRAPSLEITLRSNPAVPPGTYSI